MKQSIAIILSCLLLVSVLCGCGAKEPYVPTGNGLGEQGATPPTLPSEQEEQKFSLVYDPDKTLNPYLCATPTNRMLFSLMYQGLFTVNQAYEAEPMLCSRYWVSQDG